MRIDWKLFVGCALIGWLNLGAAKAVSLADTRSFCGGVLILSATQDVRNFAIYPVEKTDAGAHVRLAKTKILGALALARALNDGLVPDMRSREVVASVSSLQFDKVSQATGPCLRLARQDWASVPIGQVAQYEKVADEHLTKVLVKVMEETQ